MKAVILSEIDGVLKKLVWVKEARTGVYMGFCGAAGDMHLSYHQDGNVHIKHGDEYLPMYKATPIRDIQHYVSLQGYGISLDRGHEFATSDYRNTKGVDSVIYINPEIISRKRILNIIPYIIQKGAEEECLRRRKESYTNSDDGQTFEVISAAFLKLDKFPGYLVGIMLVGGAWANESQ